jgi:hypothetical protein
VLLSNLESKKDKDINILLKKIKISDYILLLGGINTWLLKRNSTTSLMNISNIDLHYTGITNRKQVLIIDDDYVSYMYFKDILNHLNIKVYRAISFEHSGFYLEILKKIDGIIINSKTRILPKDEEDLTDFKRRFKVPVIMVVDNFSPIIHSQNTEKFIDYVVNYDTDPEQLTEIMFEEFESVS